MFDIILKWRKREVMMMIAEIQTWFLRDFEFFWKKERDFVFCVVVRCEDENSFEAETLARRFFTIWSLLFSSYDIFTLQFLFFSDSPVTHDNMN